MHYISRMILLSILPIFFANFIFAQQKRTRRSPVNLPQFAETDTRYKDHTAYPKRYNIEAPIPLIGQYADPYKVLDIIGSIVVDPGILSMHAPEALRDLNEYKKNTDLVRKKKKTMYGQVIFYDQSTTPDQQVNFSKPLNLIFHPFAALSKITRQQEQRGNKYFQTLLPVGIFSPSGIIPVAKEGVAIDSIHAVPLRVHEEKGSLSFSPDNARFSIKNNRSVVDFWSYAFDEKNVTLTYHIIFAPQKANDLGSFLGGLIRKEEKEGITLRQFLYDTLPDQFKNKGYAPQDLEAWRQTHNLIAHIFAEENKQLNGKYPEFEHIHSLHASNKKSSKKN